MRKLSEIAEELETSMIDEGNRKGWAYYATHPLKTKLDRASNSIGFAQRQECHRAPDGEQSEIQINADHTSE